MNSDFERGNKVGANRSASSFRRLERIPSLLLMLYVGLAGVAALFVVLIGAYTYTRLRNGEVAGVYPLPRYFSLSTIVLLVSSYVVAQSPRLYAQDDVSGLARCLGATLLLSSIFAGLQLLGWLELTRQGLEFTGETSVRFLFLISGVHVAHVLGGMLFLLVLLVRTHQAARDAVRGLVFIRNPYRRLQLRMITLYWHFIDGVWLALFAAFLFLY